MPVRPSQVLRQIRADQAAHERVRAAAHGAGKHWAVTCFDQAHAADCLAKGARLLFHGSDLRLVLVGMAELRQQVRALGQ